MVISSRASVFDCRISLRKLFWIIIKANNACATEFDPSDRLFCFAFGGLLSKLINRKAIWACFCLPSMQYCCFDWSYCIASGHLRCKMKLISCFGCHYAVHLTILSDDLMIWWAIMCRFHSRDWFWPTNWSFITQWRVILLYKSTQIACVVAI